jgi:VanZ family protein
VYVICLIPIETSIEIPISYMDKLVHIVIYFIFTLVWFAYFQGLSISSSILSSLIKSSFVGFFTGVNIEVLQETVSKGRFADVYDVLANSLGIIIAIVFLSQLKKYNNLKSLK